MTNFEKFPIESNEPINEDVEGNVIPKEENTTAEQTVEQVPTPATLVDEKEGGESGIDWLKSDRDTARFLAGSDVRRESNIKIMRLGMEEIRKRNIDISNLSPEDLDSMIESLGVKILADRNHEWSIQKAESFRQAKAEHDEEVRRIRLEKAQNTFPNKVRNFLSRDLLGFLKKK
jgi:hypothetical protein